MEYEEVVEQLSETRKIFNSFLSKCTISLAQQLQLLLSVDILDNNEFVRGSKCSSDRLC